MCFQFLYYYCSVFLIINQALLRCVHPIQRSMPIEGSILITNVFNNDNNKYIYTIRWSAGRQGSDVLHTHTHVHTYKDIHKRIYVCLCLCLYVLSVCVCVCVGREGRDPAGRFPPEDGQYDG